MSASKLAPIVLLHGVGLDSSMWNGVRQLLATGLADSREIIALDLPGHGKNDHISSPQTLKSLAEHVLARLPAQKIHLIGFSLGALISEYIAIHHPEKIETLTLVNSVYDRSEEQTKSVASRLEMAKADFTASVDASIDRWFPNRTEADEEIFNNTRQVLLANDFDSYLAAYEVFASADRELIGSLNQVSVPTLVITGELDGGSTPAMTEAISAAIPNSKSVVVAGARHMLPVERPEVFVSEVLALVQESEGEVND